jgi:DNA gyrase subunit A
MGVKTVQLTEARGHLAGARVVRDGYQVMLISTGGTMIKMPVDDIRRMGRSTQGVIVMRLREGEQVSSLAPVVEASEDEVADLAAATPPPAGLIVGSSNGEAPDEEPDDENGDELADDELDEIDEPDEGDEPDLDG